MYCGAGEGGNRDRQRSVNTMFADLRIVLVFSNVRMALSVFCHFVCLPILFEGYICLMRIDGDFTIRQTNGLIPSEDQYLTDYLV